MLYNTGTIAVNGNTATGTGTNWTAPASQVRTGQTIIVMSNPVQIFQISAVNSATSMTVTPAASPALSDQKYGILVSDIISVDGLAQAMSQLIKEYDENIGAWETFSTTSANQSITVTINGTPVTIPGIGKLAQKGSNGALPIDQGGTGATTAADSRSTLGLGDMAVKNSGEEDGDGMAVGAFGIGRPSGIKITNETGSPGLVTTLSGYGFIPFRNEQNITGRIAASSPALWLRTGGTFAFLSIPYVSSAPVRISGGLISNGTIDYTRTLYDDLNTTKASDGTLKAASPVVKLFADGSFETNDESEGCTVTRMKAGEYLIEGCMGMNSDAAWGGIDGGFDIPKDRNGQALIWLDYEVNADGSVLVKTFHREYPTAPAFARNSVEGYVDGQPADIPADQFVSVRVEMPQNSIWNQRMTMAEVPDSSAD
ncbi:phage tail protein [Enterobacter hormaechei]|uniref:phage tail fiber protein n=1 Tax=Enterobacter hormaechei TaxID=158836 RepID=UPI0029D8A4B4|nr:phage tail protein [Enterobacter hormaechei]MDX6966654.1 phage tail protein [Enterobacter hormaechei]